MKNTILRAPMQGARWIVGGAEVQAGPGAAEGRMACWVSGGAQFRQRARTAACACSQLQSWPALPV